MDEKQMTPWSSIGRRGTYPKKKTKTFFFDKTFKTNVVRHMIERMKNK